LISKGPFTWRCIHCGRKIDIENENFFVKNSYSVPLKYIGFAQLPPNSYFRVKILHCQECHETEKEMIKFRNRMTVYLPLLISTVWMLVYVALWLVYPSVSMTAFFLPTVLAISAAIFLGFVFVFFPRAKEYSKDERVLVLHRLMLKNDYSRLLVLYQFIAAMITIIFPVGIAVLLPVAIYYFIIDRKGIIDKECFFRRIPQQCPYCSGGTSFRTLNKEKVHYYRHSENCSIFLRGWVE